MALTIPPGHCSYLQPSQHKYGPLDRKLTVIYALKERIPLLSYRYCFTIGCSVSAAFLIFFGTLPTAYVLLKPNIPTYIYIYNSILSLYTLRTCTAISTYFVRYKTVQFKICMILHWIRPWQDERASSYLLGPRMAAVVGRYQPGWYLSIDYRSLCTSKLSVV